MNEIIPTHHCLHPDTDQLKLDRLEILEIFSTRNLPLSKWQQLNRANWTWVGTSEKNAVQFWLGPFSCSTWNFHSVTVVRYATVDHGHGDVLSTSNQAQQVKSVRSQSSFLYAYPRWWWWCIESYSFMDLYSTSSRKLLRVVKSSWNWGNRSEVQKLLPGPIWYLGPRWRKYIWEIQ